MHIKIETLIREKWRWKPFNKTWEYTSNQRNDNIMTRILTVKSPKGRITPVKSKD